MINEKLKIMGRVENDNDVHGLPTYKWYLPSLDSAVCLETEN
jgi:hypothetical protein